MHPLFNKMPNLFWFQSGKGHFEDFDLSRLSNGKKYRH